MSTSETRSQSGSISVFGLGTSELRPIIETAVGEPVASFDISIENQVEGDYGFAAEKLIPTFSYVTPEGSRGRVTIFAKHSHNPNSPEPEHYRFLGLHGVPLPRLYGVLRSPKDRPILFLEYLDMSEATRATLPPEVHLEFLSLMARFNAVHPSLEYAAWLEELLQREREEGGELGEVVAVVWEHACRSDLGEALKQFCSEDMERRARLRVLADRVAAQVADMETGLVSGDFSFENTGRRQSGERVLFDVEGIGLGARFTDAAGLVGRPDDRWPPEPYPPPETLAAHYLREYSRWGGTSPPLDQFLAEARVLWLHYQIGSMGFGVSLICSDSTAFDGFRAGSRAALLQILRMLLDRYC